MLILKVALAASATLVAYGAWKAFLYIIGPLFSSLRYLPGPMSKSFVFGNFDEVWEADKSELHEKWSVQYGKVMKYKAFFGADRLFTTDSRALNHILTHSADYQKPAMARYSLSRLMGDGE
ncbi:hypothetical protein M0805_003830 [Coniferiporia weirii]|nr:hypothetical protein M0805_003830 [Coniferiporia weirii]